MTMRVRIFPFNAPCEREQDRLSPLQFVRALLKPQERVYAGEQFGSIDRAGQEVICAHLDTLDPILLVRKCCNQNHGYEIRVGVVLDLLAGLKAGEARHHYIEQHEVDLSSTQLLNDLCSVGNG